MTEQRYRWARAYRNGELLCGRLDLIVRHDDDSLGLPPAEGRYVTTRFLLGAARRVAGQGQARTLLGERRLKARRAACG